MAGLSVVSVIRDVDTRNLLDDTVVEQIVGPEPREATLISKHDERGPAA